MFESHVCVIVNDGMMIEEFEIYGVKRDEPN